MACGAAGQDLAPEVVLLARIKTHLREEFAHLPSYTCLETITLSGNHHPLLQRDRRPGEAPVQDAAAGHRAARNRLQQ